MMIEQIKPGIKTTSSATDSQPLESKPIVSDMSDTVCLWGEVVEEIELFVIVQVLLVVDGDFRDIRLDIYIHIFN